LSGPTPSSSERVQLTRLPKASRLRLLKSHPTWFIKVLSHIGHILSLYQRRVMYCHCTVCRWWQHALVNCNGLLPEILESSSRCPSEAESQPPKAKDICYCYSSRLQFSELHQRSHPATETSDPCTLPSSRAKDGLKNFSTDIPLDFTTSWA
jgi:hypothetical protein